MRGVIEALLVSALATGAATADSSEVRQERGKWRVSVGASVIGPVKSDIGVSGARMQRLSGFGTSLMQSAAARKGGRSRAEAYAAGSGAADGIRRFDDGVVYGLLGGGFALQWYDFVLAGEALWRYGGDDLAVAGRTVDGSIKPGTMGFRLSLGYAF